MVEIYTILFLSSPNKVIVKEFDRSNIETFIITFGKITIRMKLSDRSECPVSITTFAETTFPYYGCVSKERFDCAMIRNMQHKLCEGY